MIDLNPRERQPDPGPKKINNDPRALARRSKAVAEAERIEFAPESGKLRSAVLSLKSFCNLSISPKKIFLAPWLAEMMIILITGYRGTGKTWFVLGLLVAIASGQDFGPWVSMGAGACLYLDGEMVVSDVQDRLKALCADVSLQQPLYVYSEAYANQLGLKRANLLNEEWRDSVKKILLSLKIKVFCIDNISSLSPGADENSKQDWAPVNSWLLELRFAGITTILLHHTNKDGGQRGTSAREDNIDTSILLKRAPGYVAEDGASFVVNFTKSRVATRDLPKISDINMKLSENQDGKLTWIFNNSKRQNREQILKLADSGMAKKDISAELGCTFQNVSQTIKRSISAGHLTKKNKLTQSGFQAISVMSNCD